MPVYLYTGVEFTASTVLASVHPNAHRGIAVAIARVTQDGLPPPDSVTGVTCGGVEMERIATVASGDGVDDGSRVWLYFLNENLSVGETTQEIVISGGFSRAWYLSYTGGNKVELLDFKAYSQDDTGLANPSAGILAPLSGRNCWLGMVWASGKSNIGLVSPVAPFTTYQEFDHTDETIGFYHASGVNEDTDAAVTMTAEDISMIAFAVGQKAAFVPSAPSAADLRANGFRPRVTATRTY